MSAHKNIQRPVAVALVLNADGRILLQQRHDQNIPSANGKWEFPGGKVEFGESPEDAARREVKEETGCDVEIVGMVPFVFSHIWERSDGGQVQTITTCYVARLVSGIPRSGDPKVGDIKWYTLKEIKELDTLSGVNEFLTHADVG